MGLIEFEYLRAKNQARNLEEAAKRVRNEARRFDDCNGKIQHQWTGDNATKFSGKMRAIVEELNQVASQLERAAENIRDSAERIRKADTEAAREAMKKNHT